MHKKAHKITSFLWDGMGGGENHV